MTYTLPKNLLGRVHVILSFERYRSDNDQIERHFHEPPIGILTGEYSWTLKILQINFAWAGSKLPWHPEQRSFLQAEQSY